MNRRMVCDRSRRPCSDHQRSAASVKVSSGVSAGSGSSPSRCRSILRSSSSCNRRASVFVLALVALSRQAPFAPPKPGPRLVAVSGYAQPEDVQEALDAGVDEHVAKPVSPELFARLLARA